MEPKAKTYIERMGFKDKDLTTPEHDQLVIYCANNPLEILSKCLSKEKYHAFTNPKIQIGCRSCITEECTWTFESWTCPKVSKENIEDINHIKNKWNKGNFKADIILKQKIKVDIEYPVITNRDFIIGFVDVKFSFIDLEYPLRFFRINHGVDILPCNILIEVKPKIHSIGETLRQINFYKSYLKGNNSFVIVTRYPTDKELFESQGISVVVIGEQQAKLGDSI